MSLFIFLGVAILAACLIALSLGDFFAPDLQDGTPRHGRQASGLAILLLLLSFAVAAAQEFTRPKDYNRGWLEVLFLVAAFAEALVTTRIRRSCGERRKSGRGWRQSEDHTASRAVANTSRSAAFAPESCDRDSVARRPVPQPQREDHGYPPAKALDHGKILWRAGPSVS